MVSLAPRKEGESGEGLPWRMGEVLPRLPEAAPNTSKETRKTFQPDRSEGQKKKSQNQSGEKERADDLEKGRNTPHLKNREDPYTGKNGGKKKKGERDALAQGGEDERAGRGQTRRMKRNKQTI